MGKYIIELPDDEHLISWWTYIGTEDGKQHIDFHEVVKTPYDLDAIRKEVYAEGYKEGMQLSIDDAKLKKEYQRGLNDAWDAARKISTMDSTTRDKIFKKVITTSIIEGNTASEAIEKIRQYEQEQEDAEFHVGDEFVTKNNKDFGVIVAANAKRVLVLWKDDADIVDENNREFTTKWAKERFVKTGRNFPEIAEVFKKMQEVRE